MGEELLLFAEMPIVISATRRAVPINLSPGPGKRDEVAGRVRDWGEIQTQAQRQEGKETFEERVKAVRERKEREREQQRQDPPR